MNVNGERLISQPCYWYKSTLIWWIRFKWREHTKWKVQ